MSDPRMGRAAQVVVLWVLIAACSGGSPTEPGGGSGPASVAGAWEGTSVIDSTSGYCADAIPTGQSVPARMDIDQNGSSIEALITSDPPGPGSLSCWFDGTVHGTTLTLTPDFGRSHRHCGPSQDILCTFRDGVVRRELDVAASSIVGSVSGNRLEFRTRAVYDYFSKSTGRLVGRGELEGSISVTKL